MASIEKRSEITYLITVSCGYDSNGKKLRKYKTITLSDTLTERQRDKELQKAAALFGSEVEIDKLLDETQKSFKQFLQQSGFNVLSLNPAQLQKLMTTAQDYIKLNLKHISG